MHRSMELLGPGMHSQRCWEAQQAPGSLQPGGTGAASPHLDLSGSLGRRGLEGICSALPAIFVRGVALGRLFP